MHNFIDSFHFAGYNETRFFPSFTEAAAEGGGKPH